MMTLLEVIVETKHYVGLMEASRLTGIPYWRILYAHRKGALPWPARVVNTWAYAADDVERIKRYFRPTTATES
jgi:hypothetical protein